MDAQIAHYLDFFEGALSIAPCPTGIRELTEADSPGVGLSPEKVGGAAAILLRLEKKLLKNERDQTPKPVFLAVVTGLGEAPYRRPDGVCVLPIRCLGA